ncbi:hypothetical protein E2542_SST05557 [Spatholobus suberectus]|nr:hypothetical protein E2542_SST05557 [Spatholobus suberectus]
MPTHSSKHPFTNSPAAALLFLFFAVEISTGPRRQPPRHQFPVPEPLPGGSGVGSDRATLPGRIPPPPQHLRRLRRRRGGNPNLRPLPPRKRHRPGPRRGLPQPPRPRGAPRPGPPPSVQRPRRLRPPLRPPRLPLPPPLRRRRRPPPRRERRRGGLQRQRLRYQLRGELHLEGRRRRRGFDILELAAVHGTPRGPRHSVQLLRP